MTRQSAPTDGRNPFGVDPKIGYYTSKQNSDANGFRYQWGRKDPFTFPTNSEQWGTTQYEYGKYPVKIYTIDGVLIYQKENGGDNTDKQPAGGIITPLINATSMMETIKSPITYYGNSTILINQTGYTKSLWNYYWTSYSRGTDGRYDNQIWHNEYLDGYISKRSKSIYDPCPYGFKVPSNGTYNNFIVNPGWVRYSYVGGSVLTINTLSTWMLGLGRSYITGFANAGGWGYYYMSTAYNPVSAYMFEIQSIEVLYTNHDVSFSVAQLVRCIELTCLALCYH